jgi:hypothetical protein
VPFVTDFRDVQFPRKPRGLGIWSAQIEQEMMRHVAGITYNAPDQAVLLCQRYPGIQASGKPMCLVHNWFEAEEMDQVNAMPARRFDRPTLLHGGSLYDGVRKVKGLLQAVALTRNSLAGRTGLQFVQIGGGDMSHLQADVARIGLHQDVLIEPLLPRREFLAVCRGADILLLVVGQDTDIHQHQGAIPAKLYDYFLARRPILVIGPRDCEAGRIVTRCNRGLAVADDSPAEIAAAIERLLAGQGRDGAIDLSLEGIQEFEASHAVKKMSEFLKRVLAREHRQLA